MPIPIVSDITGLFQKFVGESVRISPYASETPTSWACSGLPAGVSINTTTGVISGTPTTAGLSTCSLTATNGTGTSAPMIFPFDILASPLDDEGLVELNFDLQTGQITNPSITTGPQIYAKDGSILPVALGFVRAGILRAIEITNVKATMRDDYDAPVITLFDAAPGVPLDVMAPRYRLALDFSTAAAALLAQIGEHESDAIPNEFAAKIEIEITYDISAIGAVDEAVRGSVTFALHLAKAIATE